MDIEALHDRAHLWVRYLEVDSADDIIKARGCPKVSKHKVGVCAICYRVHSRCKLDG